MVENVDQSPKRYPRNVFFPQTHDVQFAVTEEKKKPGRHLHLRNLNQSI